MKTQVISDEAESQKPGSGCSGWRPTRASITGRAHHHHHGVSFTFTSDNQ